MVTRFLVLCYALFALSSDSRAQDYSVIYTNPNASGQPGQLFLAQVKVQNNSNEDIIMHYERIVNNLPGSWTSCFCYPYCIAPWIDSASFSIAGFSVDSIMPNFGTDSIPAMATVQIVLYQQGYENSADTITFTGSTLGAGISDESHSTFITVYPNPAIDYIVVHVNSDKCAMTIRNSTGSFLRSLTLDPGENTIDLSMLPAGIYWFEISEGLKDMEWLRIVKTQ